MTEFIIIIISSRQDTTNKSDEEDSWDLTLGTETTWKASKIFCFLIFTSKESKCVSNESGEFFWSSFKYFVASDNGSSTWI